MQTYTVTHKGNVRKENEDSLYISGDKLPIFAAVADGMGGHKAGKLASENAVGYIDEYVKSGGEIMSSEDLKLFAEGISDKVYLLSTQDPDYESMGTTICLVSLDKSGLLCAHIGDSRVYVLSKDGLRTITKDHSYVQMLLDMGVIDTEEAKVHPYRNVITRAVGMEEVEADICHTDIAPGDCILLCSDGLIRHITDEEIEELLLKMELKDAGDLMLSRALERGGSDNITIVILKIESGDLK